MSITIAGNTADLRPVATAAHLGFLIAGAPDDPYVIRVVNKAGGILAELTDTDLTNRAQAYPGDIVETLNSYETFEVHFPKHAFTKDDVDILGRPGGPAMEVQVLLGGEVLAWGPAIAQQGSSDDETITLQCAGVGWYFPKRAIDEERVNLLSYGGFEHGDFQGWRTTGSWAGTALGDGVAPEIQTDLVFQGSYALRGTAAFSPTGLGVVSNPISFTAGPRGNRLGLTFSACVELFLGPALFEAAVLLVAGPAGSNGAPQGGVNAKASAVWRIDESTPRGVEIREDLEIKIPANKTWAVQVVLFFPTGITTYDHFFLAPKKKLDSSTISGSNAAGADCSRIVRMIADHTFSDLHHHGKSDLKIGLATPDCGVRQSRVYSFDEHIPVDQAIGEFLDRDDCFDARIEYTQTTRTLRLYPIADGGIGTDYDTDVLLTYGEAPFAHYETSVDGGAVANKVVALGDGSGNVREEAWYTDEDGIGGTTLQASFPAPNGARFNSLTPLARSYVLMRGRPAEALEVTITREPGGYGPDPEVILHDLLELGDTLTLAIDNGWDQFAGRWRIIRKARRTRLRTMTYTLNRALA